MVAETKIVVMLIGVMLAGLSIWLALLVDPIDAVTTDDRD